MCCFVGRIIPRFGKVNLVVERRCFEIRQQQSSPTVERLALGVNDAGRWKIVLHVVVVVQTQADLLEVAAALRAPPRFPGRTHGWKQESDQQQNNADYDEQFQNSEAHPQALKPTSGVRTLAGG